MSARDDYPVDQCIDYKRHDSDRRRYEAMADEIDALRLERDLAVAHDTQPYPTAWAYDQACSALARAKERLAEFAPLWTLGDAKPTEAHWTPPTATTDQEPA